MNLSTPSSQYYVRPPDMPLFLAHRPNNLRSLIRWSIDEHRRGLMYATQRGLYKTVKYLSEEYSPIRLLAEMSGFRRICAKITESDWRALSKKERDFILRAYELRELLFRQ